MDLTFQGRELCPACQARLINTDYAERLCQPCGEEADALRDMAAPFHPMTSQEARAAAVRVGVDVSKPYTVIQTAEGITVTGTRKT